MDEQDKAAIDAAYNDYAIKMAKERCSVSWVDFQVGAKAMLKHVRGKQEPVAKDSDERGPRLNEAAWAAIEAWNSEVMGPMTGPIFNNIKGVVRAAILNYCEGYTHPAPAVAQEPVHFRAVLCREQQDQAHGVVPKVVGFVDKKATEQFILEKRDFQGWRYNLEPLYTAPPASEVSALQADITNHVRIANEQAQEIVELRKVNAQLLEQLQRMVDFVTTGLEVKDDHPYVEMAQAAIAAAEAQQGKGE